MRNHRHRRLPPAAARFRFLRFADDIADAVGRLTGRVGGPRPGFAKPLRRRGGCCGRFRGRPSSGGGAGGCCCGLRCSGRFGFLLARVLRMVLGRPLLVLGGVCRVNGRRNHSGQSSVRNSGEVGKDEVNVVVGYPARNLLHQLVVGKLGKDDLVVGHF